MLHTAEEFARRGVRFSPHNPSGPICHAASLQIAAVAGNFDMLEVQFDESPLFASLVANGFGPVIAGQSQSRTGVGMGVALDRVVLAATADQPAVHHDRGP